MKDVEYLCVLLENFIKVMFFNSLHNSSSVVMMLLALSYKHLTPSDMDGVVRIEVYISVSMLAFCIPRPSGDPPFSGGLNSQGSVRCCYFPAP